MGAFAINFNKDFVAETTGVSTRIHSILIDEFGALLIKNGTAGTYRRYQLGCRER